MEVLYIRKKEKKVYYQRRAYVSNMYLYEGNVSPFCGKGFCCCLYEVEVLYSIARHSTCSFGI